MDIELSWLAGLIDGEGCFMIYNTHPKIINGKKLVNIRIRLEERDGFVLKIVQKLVGGRIHYDKSPSNRNKKHHNQYVWGIYKQSELLCFCKKIYPFLVLKKEKCKEVISFLEKKLAL